MRRARPYITFAALAGVAVALLAAAPAHAQQAQFEVIVVKATKDGDSMDPALANYAHLLKGKGYTNFQKLRSTSFTLAKGSTRTITIAGSLKAEITYESEVNDRVAFKCRVLKGGKEQLKINYSVPRGGKTLVVVTGTPAYMLIIEIR